MKDGNFKQQGLEPIGNIVKGCGPNHWPFHPNLGGMNQFHYSVFNSGFGLVIAYIHVVIHSSFGTCQFICLQVIFGHTQLGDPCITFVKVTIYPNHQTICHSYHVTKAYVLLSHKSQLTFTKTQIIAPSNMPHPWNKIGQFDTCHFIVFHTR